MDEFGNFASFCIFGAGRRCSRKETQLFFLTPAEGGEKASENFSEKDVELSLPRGSVDENGAGTPRKRAKNVKYTSAQKELAKKCALEEGLGYEAILKKYPDWGGNEHELRAAAERIRSTRAFSRKEGGKC